MAPERDVRMDDHPEFRELVRKKWTVSLSLTAVMLVIYFGFILVLAFGKELFMARIGEHMTMGIPVGLAVILSACVLTGVYVAWANTTYDRSVQEIIRKMRGGN